MSTMTLEIPKEQAEQIEMLAARANLPAIDVVALALQICALTFDASRAGLGAAGAPLTAKDLVEALKNVSSQTYTREQFVSDLARATLSGDAAAASAARAKARASSIGFDSMADQPKIDGATYQNDMRNAWK